MHFPDQQASWLRPAVGHEVRVSAREPVDAVFATGKPWTGLLVGLKIARQLGVPFIADFRDPWTRNSHDVWRLPSLFTRARRLERQICCGASWVVTNTEELREQFAQDYPELRDRFVAITNGFDDWTSRPNDPIPAEGRVGCLGSRTELWHFGTVYKMRDPGALLSAIDALHEERLLLPGELRLRFVGRWLVTNPGTNRLAQSLEGRGFLVREPPDSAWRVPAANARRASPPSAAAFVAASDSR